MGLDAPLQASRDISQRSLRILVQTKTHLVPGNGYEERVKNMRDLICQHHWKRNFDKHQDRWNIYGHEFSYKDRDCYFLVDHGHVEPPGEPPVLWYKWTGDSLIALEQDLPAKIQAKLREYPFTRQLVQRSSSHTPARLDAQMYRRVIRSKLRCDMSILDQDIQFLLTHPEDARWLRDNVESRFWSKIQSLCHFDPSEEVSR